ncbi:hypothetical protein NCS13_1_0787 [Neochlamydia sp. S13]|nr:hypothetical protein NCS13_1_0787 [Neochlamydia sp. S13]
MIGVEGFEPPTYCSQSSRASQAALYSEEKTNYKQEGLFQQAISKGLSDIST